MDQYFLCTNVQENGDHEVHMHDCVFLPKPKNRIDLGYHGCCEWAVGAAKTIKTSWNINGCWFCCRECHTS